MMTFDEVTAKHQGAWGEDGLFRAVDGGGYVWVLAKREAAGVSITKDGVRFGLVAGTPAPVVKSQAKKQKPDKVPEATIPTQTIDDLEF